MEPTEEHPEVLTLEIFTFYVISTVSVVGSMSCRNLERVAVRIFRTLWTVAQIYLNISGIRNISWFLIINAHYLGQVLLRWWEFISAIYSVSIRNYDRYYSTYIQYALLLMGCKLIDNYILRLGHFAIDIITIT